MSKKMANFPSDPDRPYTVRLTRKQLDTLIDATELYSRIGMGQFWSVIEHVDGSLAFPGLKADNYWDSKRSIDRQANALTGLPINAYWGIFSDKVADSHKRAWDIHQVLRQHRSFEHTPEGGCGVNFYDPLPALQEPLPSIRGAEKFGSDWVCPKKR